MHLKPNPEDNGVITKEFLKKICRSDFKQYYSTPSLNDILYLHYKGFEKIDNLEEFTGLKVIYLQGNAIKKIENLQKLVNLRCLYLQENLIREISGLDTLTNLVNLNLSDNLIEKIEGLQNLTNLSTFQIKRNRIGADGISDVIGLLQCQSISALDLSDNKIETQEILPQVLQKMTNLSVVYLQNNGFNKKIPHYRKTLITKIPTLKYIDDKPVFDDQKRFAQAWGRGGLEQQRKERALYKKEEQEKQIRQHQQFRAMIDRFKEQNKKKKYESEQSSDNQSDSQEQSLQTYNTPVESKEGSERTSQVESGRTSEVQSESTSQAQSESESESHPQEQEKQTKKVNTSNHDSDKQSKTINEKQITTNNIKPAQQITQKDSSRYLDELD